MVENSEKLEREVEVVNALGIHARPSHAIVTTASRFQADVRLGFEGRWADARSILSVMTLGASQGARIRLEATGPEAGEALEALAELFASGFREEA